MNRIVNPPELPKPSGFSHALVAGNTVYLAGQIGLRRDASSSSSTTPPGTWSPRCGRPAASRATWSRCRCS